MDWNQREDTKKYFEQTRQFLNGNSSVADHVFSNYFITSQYALESNEPAIETLWKNHTQEIDRYLKQPTSHPDYNREWMDFVVQRTKSIQNLGGDPKIYRFSEEWEKIWPSRLRKLTAHDWRKKTKQFNCLRICSSSSDEDNRTKASQNRRDRKARLKRGIEECESQEKRRIKRSRCSEEQKKGKKSNRSSVTRSGSRRQKRKGRNSPKSRPRKRSESSVTSSSSSSCDSSSSESETNCTQTNSGQKMLDKHIEQIYNGIKNKLPNNHRKNISSQLDGNAFQQQTSLPPNADRERQLLEQDNEINLINNSNTIELEAYEKYIALLLQSPIKDNATHARSYQKDFDAFLQVKQQIEYSKAEQNKDFMVEKLENERTLGKNQIVHLTLKKAQVPNEDRKRSGNWNSNKDGRHLFQISWQEIAAKQKVQNGQNADSEEKKKGETSKEMEEVEDSNEVEDKSSEQNEGLLVSSMEPISVKKNSEKMLKKRENISLHDDNAERFDTLSETETLDYNSSLEDGEISDSDCSSDATIVFNDWDLVRKEQRQGTSLHSVATTENEKLWLDEERTKFRNHVEMRHETKCMTVIPNEILQSANKLPCKSITRVNNSECNTIISEIKSLHSTNSVQPQSTNDWITDFVTTLEWLSSLGSELGNLLTPVSILISFSKELMANGADITSFILNEHVGSVLALVRDRLGLDVNSQELNIVQKTVRRELLGYVVSLVTRLESAKKPLHHSQVCDVNAIAFVMQDESLESITQFVTSSLICDGVEQPHQHVQDIASAVLQIN